MTKTEKTVFISYRHTNTPWALAIFQSLTHNGYDVFFDFHGIASGDFERIIVENIKARARFLVLLTPSALERCCDPSDLLRREIETALDTRRNIVPLMLEGFTFATPAIASQLTGKLAALKHFNALLVPPEYFDEAMTRLHERYLNVPMEAVLHPTSPTARNPAKAEQAAASTASPVQQQELTAQEWFERGLNAVDPNETIYCYSQVIKLQPDDVTAYLNRGTARRDTGDLEGALQDYGEAIRLKPDDADVYINRGYARHEKGDVEGALQDYGEAVRLKPDYDKAYWNRALLYETKENYAAAINDLQKYLELGGDVRHGDRAMAEIRINNLKNKI